MSDRRLLLDGPDLPELLARAEELGGTVVRAQRLRKGILSRQWYEVTVAVPDPSPAPVPVTRLQTRPPGAPAQPQPRPAGISALLGAAEAAERMESEATRAARAANAKSAKRQGGR
ncbi:hypothetical protein AA0Y32_16295 [Georgenia phoenicis]|uniref:hypothetical protein n=1 Tax=unclassified Georgenia TaxID=2626815 RepID=UPI0039AF49B8